MKIITIICVTCVAAHGPNGKSKLLPSIPDTGSITQNIVPEALLKHFIEMCSPSHDHSLETELANFCVFSLPAVVYTLGPENWSLVRNCFESLALRFQVYIIYISLKFLFGLVCLVTNLEISYIAL